MITKISNYQIDNKTNQPNVMFNYIDFAEESEEEIKLRNIANNRSISVAVLLDERPEEDLEQRVYDNFESIGIGTISPKIRSINMSSSKYKDSIDIENSTLCLLDNLTNTPTTIDFSLKNTSLSLEAIKKKIILNISLSSNRISMESRIGSATTIIVGSNIKSYFGYTESLNNWDIVFSDKINHDKIIVMRVEKKYGIGINVVDNQYDSLFYLAETPNYEKVIKWFTIK